MSTTDTTELDLSYSLRATIEGRDTRGLTSTLEGPARGRAMPRGTGYHGTVTLGTVARSERILEGLRQAVDHVRVAWVAPELEHVHCAVRRARRRRRYHVLVAERRERQVLVGARNHRVVLRRVVAVAVAQLDAVPAAVHGRAERRGEASSATSSRPLN